MHRQEELEHLELERALTLSMAAEEERLRAMLSDAKASEFDDFDSNYNRDSRVPPKSEAKVRVLSMYKCFHSIWAFVLLTIL